MHRTEGENHNQNMFTDGPPGTCIEEKWLNAVQEELCYVIEQAGLALKTASTDTRQQLLNALQILFLSNLKATTKVNFGGLTITSTEGRIWTIDTITGPFSANALIYAEIEVEVIKGATQGLTQLSLEFSSDTYFRPFAYVNSPYLTISRHMEASQTEVFRASGIFRTGFAYSNDIGLYLRGVSEGSNSTVYVSHASMGYIILRR